MFGWSDLRKDGKGWSEKKKGERNDFSNYRHAPCRLVVNIEYSNYQKEKEKGKQSCQMYICIHIFEKNFYVVVK